jgi:uncharacterized protein YndB with AHSA1/START domain
MKLEFPVTVKIQRPLTTVFDAVYNPSKLSQYFATAGVSAPLDADSKVMIEFGDFPGAFPIEVRQCRKNELLVFEWQANDGAHAVDYNTTVTMKFSALAPDNTAVEIVETGWREEHFAGAAGNGQGWMHFACCLKAFVEQGINLRKGFF